MTEEQFIKARELAQKIAKEENNRTGYDMDIKEPEDFQERILSKNDYQIILERPLFVRSKWSVILRCENTILVTEKSIFPFIKDRFYGYQILFYYQGSENEQRPIEAFKLKINQPSPIGVSSPRTANDVGKTILSIREIHNLLDSNDIQAMLSNYEASQDMIKKIEKDLEENNKK